MSTTTTATFAANLPAGHYGFRNLVRSEWTKLRSVRSTIWTIGITIVLGVGVSVLIAAETRAHWSTVNLAQTTFDPVATSLIGLYIAQFAIGVLGALAISSEYGTGTIRATFSAAPRRARVHVAKVAVFALVAFVTAEIVSFVAFFLGQALLSAPAIHATLSSPGALRAVVGIGIYVTLLGVFALGLATIIRHSAGAISTFVGVLLVLPLLIGALPNSLGNGIHRYLPDRIGATIVTTRGSVGNAFSPWVGLAVLLGYAVATNLIGVYLLRKRDA